MLKMDNLIIGMAQVYGDLIWVESTDQMFFYFRMFIGVEVRDPARAQPRLDGSFPCKMYIGLHHWIARIR